MTVLMLRHANHEEHQKFNEHLFPCSKVGTVHATTLLD